MARFHAKVTKFLTILGIMFSVFVDRWDNTTGNIISLKSHFDAKWGSHPKFLCFLSVFLNFKIICCFFRMIKRFKVTSAARNVVFVFNGINLINFKVASAACNIVFVFNGMYLIKVIPRWCVLFIVRIAFVFNRINLIKIIPK